jgi:Pyruvate/2-oxoacid:ferredoxin oxidoreductase gamma subunit
MAFDTSRLVSAQLLTAATNTSAACTAFGTQTYKVRVMTSSTTTFIRISDGTPTAVLTDTQLASNYPEYFTVTPGQKLAAINAGGTVTVSITELSS